ncbi:MAG: hypothetical protein IPK74_31130 [Deltaproteobacteria bacterium]|nr:hypothetical protein [Deltaproteobacteria bacterium]
MSDTASQGRRSTLGNLLGRARALVDEALPDEVRDAGRRLRDKVLEVAPAPIAAALERLGARDEAAPTADPPVQEAAPTEPSPAQEQAAKRGREEVLARVRTKAEHGLKLEDALVVIYATTREADAVDEIVALFDGIDVTVRVMDLDREPPQTKRQLAGLTDVMVPPYVYINGRHWGGQYELTALAATGELEAVVCNRLDELGEEARRIGKLHDSYADDITVDNILLRWRAGHILCVDDLDAWFEHDKHGGEHFFYQGGEHPVAEMPAVAAAIVGGVDAGTVEAKWLLDPLVHVG